MGNVTENCCATRLVIQPGLTSAMVYVDSHYYILHLMTDIMNSCHIC